MRAVHFCRTCDFRLPYCVRTDRRYCSQRCRLWGYRHPGSKRPDFSPQGWGHPEPPGRGHPRTLAEALHALGEARDYAAQLEAAAKAQQLETRRLRDRLAALRGEAAEARTKLTAGSEELQAELEKAQRRLAQLEEQAKDATAQAKAHQAQAEVLAVRVKKSDEAAVEQQVATERLTAELTELRQADACRTEETNKLHTAVAELTKTRDDLQGQAQSALARATESDVALQQARGELSTLRQSRTRQAEEHAQEVGKLKSQAAALTAQREQLAEQIKALSTSAEGLRARAERAETTLAQRDEELSVQHRNFVAAEQAHKEVHIVAESESRSLSAEKSRRLAAEQRVEQLTRELERLARASRLEEGGHQQLSLFGPREEVLWAELRDVRSHRDAAIAERELLSARILRLMSPGKYLEHAAAAGYDITKDPLIRLKREEVLVEGQLAALQASKKKRRRARPYDPAETLDEQAYAAALTFRWKQINHPHKRRKQKPTWVSVGFLLDAESEKYLALLTEERIEEIERKIRQVGVSSDL